MKIGTVRAPTTAGLQSSRASSPNVSAGIAAALGGLSSSLSGAASATLEIEEEYRLHERKKKKQNHDVEFIRWQGERVRELDQAQREAPAGAPNFTDRIHENLRAQTEDFISGIDDPELQQYYREKTETLIQNATTAAFTFEFQEGNRAFGEEVLGLLDEARLRIREDPDILGQELETFTSLIEESTLTAPQKAELTGEVLSTLQQTEYMRQVELAQSNNTPVREADGSDVVAPGMPAPYRALLNTTAGVESPGYNVIYGGERFTDYSDHPRSYREIGVGPNKGKKSSAAGRYQFLAGTWDFVVENMKAEGYDFGPEEFSPVNQDRAAAWYARHRYNNAARRAGAPPEWRDLDFILANRDREGIKYVRQVLSGDASGREEVVWEGLQHLTDDAFANKLLGQATTGATGDSPMPDTFSGRYSEIDFDTRITLDMEAKKAEEARLTAQAAAAAEREQALYAQLRKMTDSNDPSAFAAVSQALESDAITTQSMRNDLNKQIADQAEQAQLALSFAANTRAGTVMTQEEGGPMVDAFNNASGITAGLREGDQKAAEDLVANFGRSEVVPTEAVEILQQQIRSTDPRKQLYAAATLGGLYDQNPEAFAAVADANVAREAAWYNTSIRYGKDPQQLIERRNMLNQPENAKLRKQLGEDADEVIAEFDARDTLNSVTSYWQRNLPQWLTSVPRANLPAQAEQNLIFQQDYQTLFRENYVLLNGDADAAHEMTGATMSYSWSVDPLSGNLMKYSPLSLGNSVPRILGGYDWIEPTVRETTGIENGPLALIFDKQTEAEIMAGETPSYLIWTEVPFGDTEQMVPDFARDQDGQILRVPLAPSEATMEDFEFRTKEAQLEGRLDAVEREIREGEQGSAWTTPINSPLFSERKKLRAKLETLRNERETEIRGTEPLDYLPPSLR